MHEGRRPFVHLFLEIMGAGGSKGKDFGHWTRRWDRQVARGGGLRYTRAKDLV